MMKFEVGHFEAGDVKIDEAGEVYLPHSCDRWYVGGPDYVRAMIAELQAALTAIEPADEGDDAR